MAKDWPRKAGASRFSGCIGTARRHTRGVRAKRRRASAEGGSPAYHLARPVPPVSSPYPGTGGMMRMRIAPRHSTQKGAAGSAEGMPATI